MMVTVTNKVMTGMILIITRTVTMMPAICITCSKGNGCFCSNHDNSMWSGS